MNADTLASVFDTLPGLYLILQPDAPRFTIAGANKTYTAATNTDAAAIIGKSLFEVFPDNPDNPEAKGVHNLTTSLMSVLHTGKAHQMEPQRYDIHQKGSTYFEVHYWRPLNTPVFDSKGQITAIIHTLEDITEQTEAIYASKRKLDKYRSLVENILNSISDGFVALDKNWHYIYVNEKAASLLNGHKPEQLIGKNMWALFPDIEGQPFHRNIEKVMNDRVPVVMEDYYASWNKWFEKRIYPLADEGIAVFYTDVTEQKRTSVEYNEEKTRLIMNAALDAIICIDTRGRITFWNPQAEKIFGWKNEEVYGRLLSETIIPRPLRKRHKKGLANYLKTGVGPVLNMLLELEAINREGKEFPIELTILPIKKGEGAEEFFCAFIRDITERKKSEHLIRATNERYDMVAKATSDAIWDWNLLTGEVIRAGDGLQGQFGYDPQEASADNDFWRKRVHPDDLERVTVNRNRLLTETKKQYWEDEYRFLKSNGVYAHVYDKGYIIRNEKGVAVRMIGASQDISALKRSQQELEELNRSLEKRAEELASSNSELERFAYVASHDLQEPLRMVKSFLQLLDKQYSEGLDAKAKEYINFAVGGADRMKKLIQDLLAYSRVGTDKEVMQPVDMNVVLNNVLQIFQSRIEKKEITLIKTDLPVVNGIGIQLQQLLQNLIGNAVKYKGNNPLQIEVGCTTGENQFVFYVKDNGIGINPKYFDKIFVVFQRLHPTNAYSGTGIGLAICKKIVERHHGTIWVESAEGKGSVFYFSIPR